jgi:hypothetical protein
MMTGTSGAGGRSRRLILAGMIFAIAMTFIDQKAAVATSDR